MIRLFYYSSNFGDELSRYIVGKLTGERVRFTYPWSLKRLVRNYLAFLHLLLVGRKPSVQLLTAYSIRKPVLVAVGSLLESVNRHCTVWGTGMAQPDVPIQPGKVIMTRGYLSQRVVEHRGGEILHRECGDPALLMPLLFNPQVDKEYDVTVIPHRAHYERVTADLLKAGKSAHVVNLTAPQDEDIEAVVTEIKRSRLVLSSSLHGLIVAHAYGVPALWMRVEELAGGDFKFKDYFSSVDIPAYEPLAWQELLAGGLRIEPEMLEGRSVVAQSRLKGIQRALLAYAPFRVKEKYRLKENNDTD